MTPAERAKRREQSIKPYGQKPPELTEAELEARCAEVRERWAKKPYLMRRRDQYSPERVEIPLIHGLGVAASDRHRRGGVASDD